MSGRIAWFVGGVVGNRGIMWKAGTYSLFSFLLGSLCACHFLTLVGGYLEFVMANMMDDVTVDFVVEV